MHESAFFMESQIHHFHQIIKVVYGSRETFHGKMGMKGISRIFFQYFSNIISIFHINFFNILCKYQGNISCKDGHNKGQKWYGPNRRRRH